MKDPNAASPAGETWGWTVIYALASVAATAAALAGHRALEVATKGIPLALLVIQVGRPLLKGSGDRLARWLWLGLVAGLVGDLAIEFSFEAGLGAFLVGHVFYLVGMGRPRERVGAHLAAAIPAALVWGGMLYALLGSGRLPQALAAPVVIYMTAICLMWARANGRGWVDPAHQPAKVMAVGAALFVVSDACIALDRWVVDIPYEAAVILLTYYAGQWAISRAAMAALSGGAVET